MQTRILTTSYGDIEICDSGGHGPAVLMIHGNSSCKEIFQKQFESELASSSRLVALDLPGHGRSANAPDPLAGYTLAGYASAAIEVLGALGVARAAIFGWSLGGHIALDMVSRFPAMTGVMISGTPPVPNGLDGFALGFKQTPIMALAGKRDWADGDAETYARATIGASARFEPFMLAAARRTHNIAREIFFTDALSGKQHDQRAIAETAKLPLAIVNGGDDAFINAEYFQSLKYANLWEGKVHLLAGAGHAPFWEAPERFNPILQRFAAFVA